MSREKKKQEFNQQLRELLKPNSKDIIMCVLLIAFAIALAVIFFVAPTDLKAKPAYLRMSIVFPVLNLAVSGAVLFKGQFFRYFSFSAIMAKAKGIDRSRVYPTQMYVTSMRVFTLVFCLVNIIFVILVVRMII